jgi:hypothetical protein
VSPERFSINAAYVRPTTLRAWTDTDWSSWVDIVAAAGVDTIVAKAPTIRPEHVTACRRAGISLVGALTCFSDHDASNAVPPELRPVDERGERWEPMEWYAGVIPTDDDFNDVLARRCADALRVDGVDGVIFDFLRWPGHWELELRLPRQVRRSSFDPITLRRFRDWLGDSFTNDINDAAESARAIDALLAEQWQQFRIDVICRVAQRLTSLVHGSGRWAGIFVVPAPDGVRRSAFGQATALLGEVVDVLIPMTFHGILHESPQWPAEIANDVGATTDRPVIAMIQLSSDPAYAAGSDWGDDVTLEAATSAVHALINSCAVGVCYFPGEALIESRLTSIAGIWPNAGRGMERQ